MFLKLDWLIYIQLYDLHLLILCNILIFWDTEFWVFIICKP